MTLRTNQKPSLNQLVLQALEAIRNGDELVTARQIRDHIQDAHGIDYPIQTIIVVLNRFCGKGIVARHAYAGMEARQRYGYYIQNSSQILQDERLMSRFLSLAEEYFHGDMKKTMRRLIRIMKRNSKSKPL